MIRTRPVREIHSISVKPRSRKIECLYADVEWALSQGLPRRELVAMLERLVRAAAPGSEYALYGQRLLAEHLVQHSPFRAARLAQEVLQYEADDQAYAILGLAHLLLGNYKLAERAYRSALALLPHCPWYAHNLGHLLDIGRDQPESALPHLRLARRLLPDEPEVASSLAHALIRAGLEREAWPHLLDAVDGDEARARELLSAWKSQTTARSSPNEKKSSSR